MATLAQTRVLATPTIMLNGRVLKIVPGSLKEDGGGSGKVRAVSAGGNAVALVHGVDAKEYTTSLKWEMANTAENQDIVLQFHNDSNNGIPSTILIVNDSKQKAFNDVYMVNKFTADYSAEGNIPVETMSLFVP